MIDLFINTAAGGQGFPGAIINMQRLTISVDDDLAASFDALVAARGYTSRSEAMRDLVRRALANAVQAERGVRFGALNLISR